MIKCTLHSFAKMKINLNVKRYQFIMGIKIQKKTGGYEVLINHISQLFLNNRHGNLITFGGVDFQSNFFLY